MQRRNSSTKRLPTKTNRFSTRIKRNERIIKTNVTKPNSTAGGLGKVIWDVSWRNGATTWWDDWKYTTKGTEYAINVAFSWFQF